MTPPLLRPPPGSTLDVFLQELFAARTLVVGEPGLDASIVVLVSMVFGEHARRQGHDDWVHVDVEAVARVLPPDVAENAEFWFEAIGMLTVNAIDGTVPVHLAQQQIDNLVRVAPRHPGIAALYAATRRALDDRQPRRACA